MRNRRHLLPAAAAFTAASLVALLGLTSSASEPTGNLRLRLLGVNDFHGNLEPPDAGVGGAAWLTAHLEQAELPGRTIRVHAGDMVGTSPLISSWFHDEPAIEAANEMGFDVGTVGNHEFDEGGDELLRLLRGSRRTGPDALRANARGQLVNTSAPGFGGAAFPYVAANTIDRDGTPLLPPFQVIEREGERVGFIGVTTTSTPHFVLPRHHERFRFADISETVNLWSAELQRRGVEAIVVLAHAGGPKHSGWDDGTAVGEIVTETRQMSDAVDVVVAGHSHSQLNLRVPNASGSGHKLVVEALSYGVAYDRVDVTIDRASGDVVDKEASIPATHHGIEPDPAAAALVERYRRRVAPIADRVVAHTATPLTRRSGNLLRLAADAQRALAEADVAIVNAGSIRGDVDAGPVTYDELFRAQAYDHRLMLFTLRGAQVLDYIEARGGRLAIAGPGHIDPGATYTVAANELLASGDGFPRGVEGGRAVGTEVEALAGHIGRR